ncbi:programmed cell death protein 5 [Ramicandelaber brevisporus]|nr:programmed cell death protein 5 [Ramicandelaber brevisporus]
MDNDLEAIRRQRLAELQARSGGSAATKGASAGNPSSVAGGGNGSNKSSEQDDEAREAILTQILSSGARERLSRIALVKPDRARAVENAIIQMVRSGQIRGRVSEDQLVEMLDDLNEQTRAKEPTKIVSQRRKNAFDSDDDEDYGL